MFDITGKVALVTGGARGIGLGIVKELLKNGLKGVAIVDVKEVVGQKAVKDIQQEFGENKAIFLNHDISIRTQFEEAFKEAVGTFKHLDIVINNAGIFNDKDWERMIAVNLIGTTNGTLLALENYLPQNKIGEEAIILNVSSIAALIFPAGSPAYVATKCGILSLTRCLGHPLHYERKKVKVMAICPSSTYTGMFAERHDWAINEEYMRLTEDLVQSLGHIQTVDNVAKGAVQIIKEGENGSIWIAEDDNPPHEMEYIAMPNIRRYN
ncbi:hypothetical protein RI129_008225 [Pyrocoelia pectoralis]|uniref:15-hydroxyprostaglandin dehydrogenase [NAD(+)]-like n=1 Tax=Pyrocoelia pectoralis TaxID=417401 RepID=A0AAN7V894_9COLE